MKLTYQDALIGFLDPITEKIKEDLANFEGDTIDFPAYTKAKYGISTTPIKREDGQIALSFSYEELRDTFHSQNPDYDPSNKKVSSL